MDRELSIKKSTAGRRRKAGDKTTMPNIPKTLGDLNPAPYNPRKISDLAAQGLQFSLEEFGDLSGLTYNIRTGNLVTGHQRRAKLPSNAPIVDFAKAKDKNGTIGYGYVEAKDQRYHVRFVDWNEVKEKAANITANNDAISGEWTPDVNVLLDEISGLTPDIYDSTLLFKILDEDITPMEVENDEETAEYDQTPLPFESYNYVVLIFKNDIDWSRAAEHFKLKKVLDPTAGKKGGVGLGRVVDGALYLSRIKETKR